MPDFTTELGVAIFGVVLALIGLVLSSGQLLSGIYPLWAQRRNRQLLIDQMGRGPYDRATIEQSTKYYIRPKSSNIDPAQEQEPKRALMAASEDLFSKVDLFLNSDTHRRHLLILADSGTGKTSFLLNYYAANLRRRRHRHTIALVPLGLKDADRLIDEILNKSDTALFLDALDEDTKAIANHRQRIVELMEKCTSFRKVVITCRTQFFPRDEEIPIETGIARFGPRAAGERATYEFWKLYLSPFSDGEVRQYIRRSFGFWERSNRRQALAIATSIDLLSVRPMLLAHIPELVQREGAPMTVSGLYEAMIAAWVERESAWLNKRELRNFSERIALDLYANSQERGSETVPFEELTELAVAWNIKLQPWQVSGRSLLNRDALGNYKFAHRSIMEFLVSKHILTGHVHEMCGEPLTDQMMRFILEIIGLNASSVTSILSTARNADCRFSLYLTSCALSARQQSDAKSLIKLTGLLQHKVYSSAVEFKERQLNDTLDRLQTDLLELMDAAMVSEIMDRIQSAKAQPHRAKTLLSPPVVGRPSAQITSRFGASLYSKNTVAVASIISIIADKTLELTSLSFSLGLYDNVHGFDDVAASLPLFKALNSMKICDAGWFVRSVNPLEVGLIVGKGSTSLLPF